MNPAKATTGLLLLAALAWGCIATTKYTGIKPLFPKPNSVRFRELVVVDSIRPEFRWEIPEGNRPVDLIVWDGGTSFKTQTALRKTVYFRSGITGGSHLLETNLLPDRVYFWSLKLTGSTNWSKARYDVHGGDFEHHSVTPYPFRTPK
jgi:hypothetical protein